MAGEAEISSSAVDSDVSTGLSDIANEAIATGDTASAPKVEAKGKEKKVAAKPKPVELADDEVEALADKPAPKKWKLKANGKEYDVDSEDKLVAQAQRGLAIEQQYQKVQGDINRLKSDLETKLKAAEERERLQDKDPVSYLRSRFGDKYVDVAEQLLIDRAKEQVALQDMTPRERQLYMEKKAYEEKAQLHERSENERKAKEEDGLVREQERQLGDMFGEVITKNGLPKNNLTVRVMASIYKAQLDKGIELSPDETAKLTKDQLKGIADHTFAKMKPEDFIDAYPELVDGIRKVLVARARGKTAEPQDISPRRMKAPTKEVSDDDEWEKMINRLKKEGQPLAVKARWG